MIQERFGEVQEIHREDLEEDRSLFQELKSYFERESSTESSKSAENYRVADWESRSGTLFYQLLKTQRFTRENGVYLLLRSPAGEIVATSGVSRTTFHSRIAIGAVRSWTSRQLRGGKIHRSVLLPRQLEWSVKNGIQAIVVAFNDYNRALHRAMINRGQRSGVDFFNSVEIWPRPVYINYTWQWVLIKRTDPDFNFDFDSIK